MLFFFLTSFNCPMAALLVSISCWWAVVGADANYMMHRSVAAAAAATAMNTASVAAAAAAGGGDGCQPVEVSMCKDLPYNLTSMPNFVGNEEQSEAELQLSTFLPLIQLQCSSQLKFFLCSVYVPMCTDKVDIAIGPCRPLCESVRRCCEPMLRQFGFPWPASLNCSKFHPENNAQAMCMRGPSKDSTALCFGDAYPAVPPPPPDATSFDDEDDNDAVRMNTAAAADPPWPSSTSTRWSPAHSCVHLRNAGRAFVRLNKTGQCAQLCQVDVLFSIDQKRSAQVIMLVFTAVCSLLCFLALAFQLVCCNSRSSTTSKYPDAALLYICICYAAITVPYWIRAAGRQQLTCAPYGGGRNQLYVIAGFGLQQVRCTVVAISLYYFTMASHVWWIIMCICWLLVGSLGFTEQAMQRRSFTFHCVAWILPLIKVIVVFIMQTVDADELTGMCFVGNQSRQGLQFLLVPQTVYLVAGMVPLTLGFVIKLRDCITGTVMQPPPPLPPPSRQLVAGWRRPAADQQLASMSCIGLLAAFYAVPQGCLLACFAYEYFHRDIWLKYAGRQPSYETFIVKIVSVFMYGIATGGYLLWRRTCGQSSSTLNRLPPVKPAAAVNSAGQRSTLMPAVGKQQQHKYNVTGPSMSTAGRLVHSSGSYLPCYDLQPNIL